MAFKKGKEKTGGRKKGSLNKNNQTVLEQCAATGQTPLDFLIEQMRNEENPKDFRADCANKAAPYIHRKMPMAIEKEITNLFPDTLQVEFIDSKVEK
jgi:hypothetical protein